jgi:hypothetical protein
MPRKRHPIDIPESVPQEGAECPLCGRPIAEPANRHHLLPLSRGGRGTITILLHKICHDKIHSVLSEAELQRQYTTIEALQGHEEIEKFIKWVQNKEPGFYDRSVRQKR